MTPVEFLTIVIAAAGSQIAFYGADTGDEQLAAAYFRRRRIGLQVAD